MTAASRPPSEDAGPRTDLFACGHVKPGTGNALPSKHVIVCEQPRGHDGDHEHYGGYHWPNVSPDPSVSGGSETPSETLTEALAQIQSLAAHDADWWTADDAATRFRNIAVVAEMALRRLAARVSSTHTEPSDSLTEAERAFLRDLLSGATCDNRALNELAEHGEPQDSDVDIHNIVCALLLRIPPASRVSGDSDETASLTAEIERLNTPDIVGRGDYVFHEEDGFDGAADRPNKAYMLDWANCVIPGDWYVARIVTEWDDEGDPIEDATELFRSKQDALDAIAASEAKRPTAPGSEGATHG